MMNGYNRGWGMGFGWRSMAVVLGVAGLGIAARINPCANDTEGKIAMSCTFNRLLTGVSFAAADTRTRTALGDSGFGVLTEIDVAATMKKKLDVEMTLARGGGTGPRTSGCGSCRDLTRRFTDAKTA